MTRALGVPIACCVTTSLSVSLGEVQQTRALHAGRSRTTDALNLLDALRQAVQLHGSVAQVDGVDDEDVDAAPAGEEVSKRFTTEVREAVIAVRPELVRGFGQAARLVEGGKLVRFGFMSPGAVLHFSVLHPVRQSPSVRDARAKLWELSRAQALSGIQHAALITAVPRDDDPTLGQKQRESIRDNRIEIEREADAVNMRLHPVMTIGEAAERVLELAG
jgi:hypothetical protein